MEPPLHKLSLTKKQRIDRPSRETVKIDKDTPLTQSLLKEWFDQSESGRSGNYGEVRLAAKIRLQFETGGEPFLVAIKCSNLRFPAQRQAALKEYIAHHDVYTCLPDDAKRYFTRPLVVEQVCEFVDRATSAGVDIATSAAVISAPWDRATPPPPPIRPPSGLTNSNELSDEMPSSYVQVDCKDHSVFYSAQAWACETAENTVGLMDAMTVPGGLSDEDLQEAGRDIGNALYELHTCNYRHNDLALRNVMLCLQREAAPRAVIVDFGSAREDRRGPSNDALDSEIFKLERGIQNVQRSLSPLRDGIRVTYESRLPSHPVKFPPTH